MDLTIREAVLEDADWFLALNAANTPAVGPLDIDRLRALEDQSHAVMIAEDGQGERLGALVVLAPGREYFSLNYRWFERELDSFLYIDRVMVAESGRRKGVGVALYAEALELAEQHGADQLAAEVNITPPNPVSMAFHERMGFSRIGDQQLPDGKHVAMLTRKVLNPQAAG
ncbi:MAG: GNAT family N-acetyltransferase [Hirschia sp.]|nr:GNAT family N-acetyltransferase [Hirschia sp.]MBF18613.1 GNAT family N-acetyltransferase [Hirschia sp.]